MKKLALLIVAFLAIPITVTAKEKAERVEQFTFKFAEAPNFKTRTSYVDYVITHWDRSDVEVKVVTRTEAATKEVASDLLNVIRIVISKEQNGLSFTNTFNNDLKQKSQRKSRSTSISVTCYVSIPKGTVMNLNSKYGDFRIDKATTPLSANLEYSDLTISDEAASSVNLVVAYGDVKIGQIVGTCDADFRYGDLKIGKANILKARLSYSDLAAQEVTDFIGSGRYSDIKIEKVKDFKMSGAAYGDVTIGSLGNSFEATGVAYSDVVIRNVSPEFTKINIPSATYSDIKMAIPSGSFTVNITNRYAECRLYDISNDKEISRTIGNNPKGAITISSAFGDVKITK